MTKFLILDIETQHLAEIITSTPADFLVVVGSTPSTPVDSN